MRKSILVAGIVLCLFVGTAVACPPSCPPGTHCTDDKGCLKCPSSTYQDQETNSSSCIDCRPTCFQKEFTVRICTALADLICQCDAGFYNNKLPTPFGTCVPHLVCQPGYGAKIPGSHLNNTVCESCQSDYFSANYSSTEQCVLCTSCLDGEEVTRECTPTSDRQCQLKDCGHLEHPDNGLVNTAAGTTYLKKAVFSCNHGYYISGPTTLWCMISGNWSDSPPVCLIKDEDTKEGLSDGHIVGICIGCFFGGFGITIALVVVWKCRGNGNYVLNTRNNSSAAGGNYSQPVMNSSVQNSQQNNSQDLQLNNLHASDAIQVPHENNLEAIPANIPQATQANISTTSGEGSHHNPAENYPATSSTTNPLVPGTNNSTLEIEMHEASGSFGRGNGNYTGNNSSAAGGNHSSQPRMNSSVQNSQQNNSQDPQLNNLQASDANQVLHENNLEATPANIPETAQANISTTSGEDSHHNPAENNPATSSTTVPGAASVLLGMDMSGFINIREGLSIRVSEMGAVGPTINNT